MENMSLYSMTEAYKRLLSMLYDDEADESAIIDTLDSIEGAMEVKADSIASIMQALQGDIDILDAEIKRLQARKKVFENKKARLQAYLEQAMRATGKTKFSTALFSYSIRKAGARALVLDVQPEQLPAEFQKITVAADKDAIKAAMKAHGAEKIEGVGYLAPQTEYLSIK